MSNWVVEVCMNNIIWFGEKCKVLKEIIHVQQISSLYNWQVTNQQLKAHNISQCWQLSPYFIEETYQALANYFIYPAVVIYLSACQHLLNVLQKVIPNIVPINSIVKDDVIVGIFGCYSWWVKVTVCTYWNHYY